MSLFSTLPDHETWKPVANTEPPDGTDCYQAAADRLGITIKIARPVPCEAGHRRAVGRGLKGIYILRTHADHEHALVCEAFNQKSRMSS